MNCMLENSGFCDEKSRIPDLSFWNQNGRYPLTKTDRQLKGQLPHIKIIKRFQNLE